MHGLFAEPPNLNELWAYRSAGTGTTPLPNAVRQGRLLHLCWSLRARCACSEVLTVRVSGLLVERQAYPYEPLQHPRVSDDTHPGQRRPVPMLTSADFLGPFLSPPFLSPFLAATTTRRVGRQGTGRRSCSHRRPWRAPNARLLVNVTCIMYRINRSGDQLRLAQAAYSPPHCLGRGEM